VFGGEGTDDEPNGVFPDHDVYNPMTDEWRELAPMPMPMPMPIPVHGVTGAAFIGGLIDLPGGGVSQEAAAAVRFTRCIGL